ncbi:hypothetical protein AAFF_G00136680 [Aldrovandia affinis]|uniref:BRCT domain-containing protein n=1 Tax=Aldrovandia affinis TaxID=143900 RepID=A0AAD7X3I2_9TELE|nr:hypothetical protein AAFF_G00136680 [Aldrovandia affinis]
MTSNNISDTLKDVVAFVDVWSSSKTENYSEPFIQQLEEMGAVVSKTFNKRVTHVVFKHGHQSTWNKAKKTGVRLVSVFWVARCKDCGEHVDEESCPAVNKESNSSLALNKRTHRCMQPRDIPTKTPENDRSMKRKLGQMIKDLVVPLPSPSAMSPYIIDEGCGIVYSPLSMRARCMAQRLKVMKEKRESLSQTDSYAAEDDSSDVDMSFSDCHGYSASNTSEGENEHCSKLLTFDLDTCESSVENRKRAKHHKEQASPLGIFSQRKSSLLTPDARSSSESFRVSPPEDDGVFDSYFSPANKPESSRRRLPPLLSLMPEPTPLPAFELEPKPRKRKRCSGETDGPGPARGKRRMSCF